MLSTSKLHQSPSDLEEPVAGTAIQADVAALPWRDARERYLCDFELSYARAMLERCGGNISAAAREAGVDRKTFYALLRKEHPSLVGE